MKIKSIVLTAALATAFSAFSGSVDVDWFTTNANSVASFDTAVSAPVVVTNSVPVPEGWTIASYAITAHVTNLVVFAEVPAASALKTGAKGAICAANDKWYGLKYTENTPSWDELSGTAPTEGRSYKFRMDFANNGNTVTYSVNDLADNTVAVSGQQLNTKDATSSSNLPNLCAFAGMGFCTNIVGEIVVAFDGTMAKPVSGGTILISTNESYSVVRGNPNSLAANGLENWVNYVLGIDSPTVTTKPFVAPVQNVSTNTLDLKLGGVAVRDQNETGAKVTYSIDELDSLEDNEPYTVGTNVDPNATVTVGLDNKDVKYYRIKIKIDPAK